jgi:AcrR family transcriptional regulator
VRPSNRDRILDAAVRVIQREGVTAVTFDSVAAEAELTRGGIMYHFPSRDDLLVAIHQHLADSWEASLLESATHPEWVAPWNGVLERWAPVPTDVGTDAAAMARLVTRLAADGLWLFEALAYRELPEAERRAVAEHLVRTLAG